MNIIDCKSIISPNQDDQSTSHDTIIYDNNILEKTIEPCLEILGRGGVIVYPTDTIYALGVNAYDTEAVQKIPSLKQRPSDMPISIAVPDLEALEQIAVVTSLVQKIYNKFLPGGLTLILELRTGLESKLPAMLVSESNKIGIRVPKHSLALTLIKQFGKPLTATSANLHSQPMPVNISTAVEQLGNKIDIYLDCGECKYQGESTIIDVTNDTVNLIREGVISRTELESQLEVPING